VAEFMERAKQEIPTFSGIKYTSGDLEKGILTLKHGQVFLGSDTVLLGALALGFNSAIMTTLNICPEYGIKILESFKKGDLKQALELQRKLNYEIQEILKLSELWNKISRNSNRIPFFFLLENNEFIPSMKAAFNSKFPSLNMGATRNPL
jgi:N-acetylneuraminate lyase